MSNAPGVNDRWSEQAVLSILSNLLRVTDDLGGRQAGLRLEPSTYGRAILRVTRLNGIEDTYAMHLYDQ